MRAGSEESVAGLGFPAEKRFHAHITVGRTEGGPLTGFASGSPVSRIEPVRGARDGLRLMKSDLTRRAARTPVLREFRSSPSP